MITSLTEQQLVDFETDIANCFNEGLIKAPVHLYDGNEKQILNIFRKIEPRDWIFCTWRSHYQCLLKGVQPDKLKQAILSGKSISLCFPEERIYSSAIVTGSIPIATGVALGISLTVPPIMAQPHVYCFIGDMAAETGVFNECWRYACKKNLPITYIIEDNGKSVCTLTHEVWNNTVEDKRWYKDEFGLYPKILYYKYQSKYPHAGAGRRIQF